MRVKDLGGKMPQQEIRERLGLHPRYPLDKTLKQARTYNIPRLRKAFHCLLDTDVAIKTGKYDDDLALDLLVIDRHTDTKGVSHSRTMATWTLLSCVHDRGTGRRTTCVL